VNSLLPVRSRATTAAPRALILCGMKLYGNRPGHATDIHLSMLCIVYSVYGLIDNRMHLQIGAMGSHSVSGVGCRDL
jgi:hypothetical protein